MRRGFEGRKADASTLGIEDPERRIVRANQGDRPFQYERGHLAKIRASVQGIRNSEQCALCFGLTLFIRVKARILITNRNLASDCFQKRDLIVEPYSGRAR